MNVCAYEIMIRAARDANRAVSISRWHIMPFTGKHYVTTSQAHKQLLTSNLSVMDGHNNTTSLSKKMSHVVVRFRSICLRVWLENISAAVKIKNKNK